MDYKHVDKKDYSGKNVKVLDETYEPGLPDTIGCGKDPGWRANLTSKELKLNYLKTGERYWYSDEWFGSEMRK